MADYFFVLDADEFELVTRPALADAWRLHTFEAARRLCGQLVPAAREYAARYHTGTVEPLLVRIASGLVPFDRTLWRALVGEVLLFAALECPEFQVNAATLTCLLAKDASRDPARERARFVPIEQVLRGSRDLSFGTAVYRPDHAGYNAAGDVKRLADYLGGVHPEQWSVTDLAGLPEIPRDDWEDELAFAREWFPALVALYRGAAERARAIVYESIY